MRPLAPLPVLAAALAAVAQHADRPPTAAAAVEAAAEILREEHFVLEQRAESGARPDQEPPLVPVGVAVLRKRREAGVEQAEWELHFFAEETRVHHVERWREGAPRLVWREWRPGGGRTLVADSDLAASRVALVEWGRGAGLRANVDAPDGVLLPLYALELARRGDLAEGSFPCFDPLSRTIERWTVELEFATGGDAGEVLLERRVRLLRDDGTCAGAYRFRGGELVAFAWQRGGLSARRVARSEHESLLAPSAPAADAALLSR